MDKKQAPTNGGGSEECVGSRLTTIACKSLNLARTAFWCRLFYHWYLLSSIPRRHEIQI